MNSKIRATSSRLTLQSDRQACVRTSSVKISGSDCWTSAIVPIAATWLAHAHILKGGCSTQCAKVDRLIMWMPPVGVLEGGQASACACKLQAGFSQIASRSESLRHLSSLPHLSTAIPAMPSTFSRRLHASCCVILWGFQAQAFRSMAKGVNCLRPTSQFLSFSGARRAPSLVVQIRLRHLARGRVPDVPVG